VGQLVRTTTQTKMPERRRAPRYHTQYVHLNAMVEDVMELTMQESHVPESGVD
jgi:hypothetical protein